MPKRLVILLTALLSLTLYSSLCSADRLKPGDRLARLEFQDQFDHPHNLEDQTNLVFFAKSKQAGSLMTNILADVSADRFSKLNAVFISDISGIPSLVTRLFVLPEMRDIEPPILLVREPEKVAWLPREEEKVTVIKLAGGKVDHISFTDDEVTLKTILGLLPTDSL
ncbi:hypothetical protein A3195_14730 [Candidatus Thiodiazotropha endoloripes]|uniref:FAD/FMN-containing dehydrogenase n=2 Tax=Candidatus Thiodiazotropha endoloripes TaxID=1818881 RepID=A0A1E2UT93_9GAMM|nr:hypothetical protein A3194_15250 [Candidatus Thiodiazotropha endoloripes]ODB86827.1 hypothetical protein A3195_14730 [Candidatus Thiodiazotropha endoloripes]ODB88854.1 hypothetical protein A3193_08505 [Candidatus Thiodiazotropha endoloripes]ODB97966.1 hypothetical protein A3196_15070 [Candidatus Thiodiazotropha endoloripes]